MKDISIIRVFMASPGDLTVEREVFRQTIEKLNGDFATGARVKFVGVGWEETISPLGRRPQSEFNAEVEKCHVFILGMFKRWGQRAPDITPPATSYTEEEFNIALRRWDANHEIPIIHVLFKNIDSGLLGDPGPQLRKVLKFRKRLEKSGRAVTIPFANEHQFRVHLLRLLKDAAHRIIDGNREPQAAYVPVPIDLPKERLANIEVEKRTTKTLRKKLESRLQKLRKNGVRKQASRAAISRAKQTTRTQTQLALTKREQNALRLAEKGAKAALEGRIEEARQDFAKAIISSTNLGVLDLAQSFYRRIGDLTTAEEIINRCLVLSVQASDTSSTASALRNLGVICITRGELERAEELLLKAQAIFEKLGDQFVMPKLYNDLGLICQTRGELERAEALYKKALAIAKRHKNRKGMASCYGRLGMICETRGELVEAEVLYIKAISIYEKLGNEEGMASGYGNIGLLYQKRGELCRAEKSLLRAQVIFEKLGNQEAIASGHGNIGLICLARGELKRAEELLLKALAIDEKIGSPEGMANKYGNLGLIYTKQGESERAIEWYEKALVIFRRLGHQEGLADGYYNLGLIYSAQGEQERPRYLWVKARDLYVKLGIPRMVEELQHRITAFA